MGVSKNRGTPKWMILMENPIKMDDLGVPLFLETSIYQNCFLLLSYKLENLEDQNKTHFYLLMVQKSGGHQVREG